MGKQSQGKQQQGKQPKRKKDKQARGASDQRTRLGRRFDVMDVDSTGFVDAATLEAMAERLALRAGTSIDSPEMRQTRSTLDQLWRALDADRNGRLSRDEYIESMTRLIADSEQLRRIVEPGNRALFTLFDADGDGRLSREEYQRMYHESGMPSAERQDVFDALDRDGDGYVSIEEFVKASLDFYLEPDPDHPAGSLIDTF